MARAGLVATPAPRSGHLRRAVLAAIAMWVFWILAYVVGLSNHGFYHSFHHVAGGLERGSRPADRVAVLWFVAAVAFIPVIFWNALTWLQSEDDPDTELLALARAERRRGTAAVDLRPGGVPRLLPDAQPRVGGAGDRGQVDGCQVRVEVAVGRISRLSGGRPVRRESSPPLGQVARADGVARVVHQRLHVLDRPQRVRRRPQRRRRDQLASSLPAGCPAPGCSARS